MDAAGGAKAAGGQDGGGRSPVPHRCLTGAVQMPEDMPEGFSCCTRLTCTLLWHAHDQALRSTFSNSLGIFALACRHEGHCAVCHLAQARCHGASWEFWRLHGTVWQHQQKLQPSVIAHRSASRNLHLTSVLPTCLRDQEMHASVYQALKARARRKGWAWTLTRFERNSRPVRLHAASVPAAAMPSPSGPRRAHVSDCRLPCRLMLSPR